MAKSKADKMVERWNNDHQVGTRVDVKMDSGKTMNTRTRSEAWVIGKGGNSSHEIAVIKLEGITGGYLLERVKACQK